MEELGKGSRDSRVTSGQLGGGNSNICYVHWKNGEDSHFDEDFSRALVQPPTSHSPNKSTLGQHVRVEDRWTESGML